MDAPPRALPINHGGMPIGGDDPTCVCGSAHTDGFMIACDSCNIWFHGVCVQVTPEEGQNIRQYYCPSCRRRDATLFPVLESAAYLPKVTMDPAVANQMRMLEHNERPMDDDDESLNDQDFEDDDESYEEEVDQRVERKEKAPGKRRKLTPKQNNKCGVCEACLRTEDCEKCTHCKDMRKYGGANRLHQKCKLKFCTMDKRAMKFNKNREHGEEDREDEIPRPQGQPQGQLQKEPLKKKKKNKQGGAAASGSRASVARCEEHVDEEEVNVEDSELSENEEDEALESGDDYKPPKAAAKKSQKKSKKKGEKSKRKRAQAADQSGKEKDPRDITYSLKQEHELQCMHPDCKEKASIVDDDKSKYCSHECGTDLALRRLNELIPPIVEEIMSDAVPFAEIQERQQLERLVEEHNQAKDILADLLKRHSDITRLRHLTLNVKVQDTTEDAAEGEADTEHNTIYCVSCGNDVPVKGAYKHVKKCYIKYEKEMSFGGQYPTVVGQDTICDQYNVQTQTYCKRLKITCPEHTKDPKPSMTLVCGSPLYTDHFKLKPITEFCCVSQAKCIKHLNWEKSMRAELDMAKVRMWSHLEDLIEQEQTIRRRIAARVSVSGLLSNGYVMRPGRSSRHGSNAGSSQGFQATYNQGENEENMNPMGDLDALQADIDAIDAEDSDAVNAAVAAAVEAGAGVPNNSMDFDFDVGAVGSNLDHHYF